MRRLAALAIVVLCAGCLNSSRASLADGPAPAGEPPIRASEPPGIAAADLSVTQTAVTDTMAVDSAAVDSILDTEILAELRLQADSLADAEALDRLAAAHAPDGGDVPGVAGASGKGDVTWDIDVETFGNHDRVQYWLDFFQGRSRERFGIWLERLPLYEDMIRERLQVHGLPTDLVYLALIESGMSNSAVSRSRAVGMWQFMAPTARHYGLKIDSYVDERRDPYKATDAAARFLADLNRQFGSLYLAAAAYNAGGGRISRSINRMNGDEDDDVALSDSTFFELYDTKLLHRETRDYVPKLIAAALIAKEPERYGFTRPDVQPLVYDSIVVTGMVGLDVVARLADTTLAAIRDLNRQYVRLATPPSGTWVVRVPSGLGAQTAEAYAKLPPNRRVTTQVHLVKRGEVLGRIARKYGVRVSDIERANPKLKRRPLLAGERIVIPIGPGSTALARADDVGTTPSRGKTHLVKRGETLSGIAQRYGVSQAKLREWNGLGRSGFIKAGQRLKVGSASASEAASRRSTGRTHVVRSGDTLSELAEKYGVSVRSLREANNLRSDRIKAGTKLKIPA
ncbi:MAG: LysM peptidoglycan-binding domain-containing protein [Gemmatimonadota bacterium]|nr:LysM peptidoglycan-binding domain-containing protein [Gemmatimonadota bacterium]